MFSYNPCGWYCLAFVGWSSPFSSSPTYQMLIVSLWVGMYPVYLWIFWFSQGDWGKNCFWWELCITDAYVVRVSDCCLMLAVMEKMMMTTLTCEAMNFNWTWEFSGGQTVQCRCCCRLEKKSWNWWQRHCGLKKVSGAGSCNFWTSTANFRRCSKF